MKPKQKIKNVVYPITKQAIYEKVLVHPDSLLGRKKIWNLKFVALNVIKYVVTQEDWFPT